MEPTEGESVPEVVGAAPVDPLRVTQERVDQVLARLRAARAKQPLQATTPR